LREQRISRIDRERVCEVVGVQPREVEKQRFEMEKGCVVMTRFYGMRFVSCGWVLVWSFSLLFISNVGHCYLLIGI